MKQTCLYRPGIGGPPDCGLADDVTRLQELLIRAALDIDSHSRAFLHTTPSDLLEELDPFLVEGLERLNKDGK